MKIYYEQVVTKRSSHEKSVNFSSEMGELTKTQNYLEYKNFYGYNDTGFAGCIKARRHTKG